MHQVSLKVFLFTAVLGLPVVSLAKEMPKSSSVETTGSSETQQSNPLNNQPRYPNEEVEASEYLLQGQIQLNKHVYYAGETLQLNLIFPEKVIALKPHFDAYLLVYTPKGETIATPITQIKSDQLFFKMSTKAFPKGDYYLALAFTKTGGNPFNVNDWYNGLTGLTNLTRLKITTKVSSALDEEDTDGNGEIDGDNDRDGFSELTH